MQGAPPRARERRVLTTVGWMAGPDAFESYEPFVRGGGLPVKLSAYRPPRRARKESPVAVLNVHERVLTCSEEALASLIDGLAGDEDRLRPRGAWPPMTFDRPLEVGATGGHGPIRYRVSDYVRGHWIRFRFTEPRGLEKTASTARSARPPDRSPRPRSGAATFGSCAASDVGARQRETRTSCWSLSSRSPRTSSRSEG